VLLFIYCCDERSIGHLRLDIKDDTGIISYSIDPFFRGKGYGYRMIALGEKVIQKDFPVVKWIQAMVKYENKASLSIFRKLNYIESQESGIVKFIKSIFVPEKKVTQEDVLS
jgi:RimJ/RimL family protein N-acetyltransferase